MIGSIIIILLNKRPNSIYLIMGNMWIRNRHSWLFIIGVSVIVIGHGKSKSMHARTTCKRPIKKKRRNNHAE